MRNEEVKKDIVDSVLLIRHPNVTVTEPEIVALRSPSPYELSGQRMDSIESWMRFRDIAGLIIPGRL